MSNDSGSVSVVLFTRDLRVHDNPALHAAVRESTAVVPLFVLDSGILSSDFNRPNRAAFLAESLADLDAQLARLGGRLVVRHGDVADEVADVVAHVGARTVHLAGDASGYATRREQALQAALDRVPGDGCQLVVHDDSLFVVPPGRVTATGKNHMAVFTPYFRKWSREPRRAPLAAPAAVPVPRLPAGKVPTAADI